MIDGASPLRILFSVILPQSIPALVAVGMFHFMWSWNDFFQPLLYLSTERELQPISIGIQLYNARFFAQPHMIQASSLLGLLVPIIIFFLTKVGLVTPEILRKYRKIALVVVLTLSAVITPPDVASQIIVAVPVLLLYQVSIYISSIVLKRELKKAKNNGESR